MYNKLDIDQKREASGWADIGTKEDGAIMSFAKIGERTLIIKENSIYELFTADNVDPSRTNIDLPTTIHKIIVNQGTDSETVSKTFLTALTLFKPTFFDNTIQLDEAMNLSLKLLYEITVLEKEINDYLLAEKKEIEKYEDRKNKAVSYSLPSITNIETRCKTIFQKADHIEQLIMKIVMIFYPNEGLNKQPHFPKFYEIIKNKYGEEDIFVQFIGDTVYLMSAIRGIRNSLDHTLSSVKIVDFELQINSDILEPTIELDRKEVKLERQSLNALFVDLVPDLIYVFQGTIIHMSNKNVKQNFLAMEIREVPLDKRKYKHVQYSFWSPIGIDGYYNV